MSESPAFSVRAYPAFRPARVFRVFVHPDALDFIRMRGLISASDAGAKGFDLNRERAMFASIIRWWAKASHEKALAEVEGKSLDELLAANRQNYRVTPSDVTESTLSPPGLLDSGGVGLARWRIAVRGRKTTTYQIEDVESLRLALEHLPRLLGSKLVVTVGWDEKAGTIVRTG